MDHPSNSVEEAAESVNPGDHGLSAFKPSESNAPAEPNEVLLRISQDMARGIGKIDSSESPNIYGKKTWG